MNDSRWSQSLRDRLKRIVSCHAGVGTLIEHSDIVNSAIVTAYRRREQFRGETDAEFHAWLRKIVENKYYARSRSELAQRRGGGKNIHLGPQTRLDCPSPEKSPEDKASDHEVVQLLGGLLDHIGEEHAELLYLVNYCELSHAEIAAKLDLTKNQVTGRVRTANKRLADAVKELGLEGLEL